jgi:hypothetical protein
LLHQVKDIHHQPFDPSSFEIGAVDRTHDPQVASGEKAGRERVPCASSIWLGRLPVTFEDPAQAALAFSFGDALSFVMQLFSAGQAEFELGPSPFVDVDAQRHDRVAAPGRRLVQGGDLAAVEQQLAFSAFFVVEAVALLGLCDIDVEQPRFTVFDQDANPSCRLTLPARTDLISVPVNTSPAS